MLNPGRLKHFANIEGPIREEDDEGGYTETFDVVAQAWVEYEPLEGREQLEAMQTQARATGRIRMWYRTDLAPDMRITFGGRTFTIVAPPFTPGDLGEVTEVLVMENVSPPQEVAS